MQDLRMMRFNPHALPLEEIKEKPPQTTPPPNIVNLKKGAQLKKQTSNEANETTPKIYASSIKRREKLLPSLKN